MSGVYTYSYLKYEAKVSGATRRGVTEQTVQCGRSWRGADMTGGDGKGRTQGRPASEATPSRQVDIQIPILG